MQATERRELPWWQILLRYSIFESSDSAWSLIIVSTYFGTFMQVVLGRSAADFGKVVTIAALVIAVMSPLMGAAADNSGRRLPYLRFFTIGVVLATAGLAFANTVWLAMTLFIIGYICANGAFTFFTAMVPAVSTERNVSTVISMSVGVGYAGGLVSMLLMGKIAPTDELAGRVFLPMAIIYLIFALPPMLFSPDLPQRSKKTLDIGAAYRRIGETFKEARKHRYLFRFLIGDFLYENAVVSVITLMGAYARNVMEFKAGDLLFVFGPAIIVSMLSAWFLFGPLVKKIGAKKTVLLDLAIWLLLFAVALLIRPGTTLTIGPVHLGTMALFAAAVAPLAGLGLAGVWSSSRVLFTALTPVEKSGEFWGLYNLSGRTASVLGDATWTAILTFFGEKIFGYQMAIVALSVYIVAGGILVLTLPDARPTSANFARETA